MKNNSYLRVQFLCLFVFFFQVGGIVYIFVDCSTA